MAETYFRGPRAACYRVGVAGTGDGEALREAGQALRESVRALGDFGVTALEVHELGVVSEERLDRLAREVPEELDLLLWLSGEEPVGSLRTGYLLGIFAWATEAPRVLCILPEAVEPRSRRVLTRALNCSGSSHELEFLIGPGGESGGSARWWLGMLQAAMAREDAHRRVRSSPSSGPPPTEGDSGRRR